MIFNIDPTAGAIAFFIIAIGFIMAAIRPSSGGRSMRHDGREKMKIGDKEYWV